MRKELLLAILIGLLVGLVIVFGIYRTRVILRPTNENPALENSPTPEPSAEVMSNLVVHSPLNESIQDTDEITIAGTSNTNEFIVILVNGEEFITTSDESGNFSISATLENGSNIIEVNAINEDGQITTEELTVIYSTVPLLDEEQSDQEITTDETTQEENAEE